MSIDLFAERVIPLRDYPKHVPTRNGKRLSRYAGYRHAVRGVRGIKLETIQLPSGRHTSLEAIARFIACLTAQTVPKNLPLPHAGRKANRRQTQIEREINEVRAKIRKKGGG